MMIRGGLPHPEWSAPCRPTEVDLEQAAGLRTGLSLWCDPGDPAELDAALQVLELCPTVDQVVFDRPLDPSMLDAVAVLREANAWAVPATFTTLNAHPAWDHLGHDGPVPQLYARRGPGWTQIVDNRPGHGVRMTFTDPDDVEFLASLDTPTPVADAARVDFMVDHDMAWRHGDQVVSLVPRLRRWPLPLDDLFSPPRA